jgi:phosphatidylserine decarboxylase
MRNIRLKKRWAILWLLLAAILLLALYPTPRPKPLQFVVRENGQIRTEKVPAEKWLLWLYHNPVGEATLWTLVKRKAVSSFYGRMMDKPASIKKIKPFVEEYHINMNEAVKEDFSSFNDFFTRKLKPGARPVDTSAGVVVSPADGKLLACQDISNSSFIIKGNQFNVYSFLQDSALAQNYKDGSLLVIRLAPPDYHRFHYPVSGSLSPVTKIDGYYYSVNPIALRQMIRIFCENKRQYQVISNPRFGDVIMAEVGATMVGGIVQTFEGNRTEKGDEAGYFRFGGSTVVLLFEKGRIRIDPDLLQNSFEGLETEVEMGEEVGSQQSAVGSQQSAVVGKSPNSTF